MQLQRNYSSIMVEVIITQFKMSMKLCLVIKFPFLFQLPSHEIFFRRLNDDNIEIYRKDNSTPINSIWTIVIHILYEKYYLYRFFFLSKSYTFKIEMIHLTISFCCIYQILLQELIHIFSIID